MIASQLELSSLTIDEVLSPDYVPTDSARADTALAERRLSRWCEIAADGDWDILHKRLGRDGLSMESVLARFGGVDRRPECVEPRWVADCRQVLRILMQAPAYALAEADGHAFGSLLAPLVAAALAEVSSRCALMDESLVAVKARSAMIDHLWQQLVSLCELPLYRSLARWRNGLPEKDRADAGEEGFTDFEVFMRNRGFEELFDVYPVLLRLLVIVCRQWTDSYAEFTDRLAIDREGLAGLNPLVTSSSVLTGLRYGLSDPHNGGRSVLLAIFDQEHRLVYKPKDLATDLLVSEVLALLRSRGFGLSLTVPRALNRAGYGWTDFVEQQDCNDAAEVTEYFHRAGAWLGVFHLLCASDIHMENLLASGAHPVPVDFETIFQGPTLKPHSIKPAMEAAWLVSAYLERSVLAVGLLPAYVKPDDLTMMSVGGLEPSTVHRTRLVWHAMNSLRMRPGIARETQTIASNLPTLKGKIQTIAAYRESFVASFQKFLLFAKEVLPELLAAIDDVRARCILVRRVVRPTRFYDLLLRRMADHRSMTDSVTWSMQTEFIARLYSWESENDELWGLFIEERKALAERNIPVFYTAGDYSANSAARRDLNLGKGVELALSRIAGLTDSYIEEQSRIVAASLQIKKIEGITRPLFGTPRAATATTCDIDLPVSVHEHLCKCAFKGEQGVAWLLLEYFDREASAQLVPVAQDVYNGSCGIGLFFAALARTRDLPEAARMARAAVVHLTSVLRSADSRKFVRAVGVGGGIGMGSIIYGLATIATLLDDSDLLDAAVAAANALTDEAIRDDSRFDVIGGAAGTCLALLRVYGATGVSALRDRAIRCADHLEVNRPSNGSAWSSLEFGHQPLTGMSHGAAGYALAFSRLYAATGVARYRQIAQSCVQFEDEHFDVAHHNWCDLRRDIQNGQPWWPTQWCYGAAGIVYARIAMVADGTLDPEMVANQARSAAELTISASSSYSNDTLCCGVAGQADFLLEAGRYLSDDTIKAAAIARMAEVAGRWSRLGDVNWDIGSKEYNLGLFRGVAGIGYASLRMENPNLPRVLVWA